MAITDPIADMFTRIRNAQSVKHETVEIPFSVMKSGIAKLLKEEGFITAFEVVSEELNKKNIKVNLKYRPDGTPVITKLRTISRPGCRRYEKKKNIPKVKGGFGINILSTNIGILTGRDARKSNVGGELLGEVW